jgi:cysteine desulfurase
MAMTSDSGADPIYLDHNAITPLASEALDALLPFLQGGDGNPSSEDALCRQTHDAIENGLQQVAALIDAVPDEVITISGGSLLRTGSHSL